MNYYYTIFYIILGIAPSLIWLSYYLSKDLHPEPKRMILKVFFWGVLMTIPVFFVQVGLTKLFDAALSNLGSSSLEAITKLPLYQLSTSMIFSVLIYWFIIISLSEEFFKYLAVRLKVFDSHHLDEPVDIMLYMVIAALGFAALENVLYMLPTLGTMPLSEALVIDLVRSIGAVFLHTLCAAVIGYSLVISFREAKWKKTILATGIFMATALHGIFDFSIMTLSGPLYINIIIPIIIILTLAFIVFSGFEKAKKMKSICKIK